MPLIVKVHPDGKIEMEVRGEPGPACKKTMAQATAALGQSLVVREDRATSEFYQEVPVTTRQKVRA